MIGTRPGEHLTPRSSIGVTGFCMSLPVSTSTGHSICHVPFQLLLTATYSGLVFLPQEEKLKAAHALTAKLEAEVERLEADKGTLRNQLLRQDFDLAHLRSLKGILESRVLDIDNAIAARDAAVSARV
jgi:hypothetical protein